MSCTPCVLLCVHLSVLLSVHLIRMLHSITRLWSLFRWQSLLFSIFFPSHLWCYRSMRTQCSLCHQGLNPLLSLVSLSCFTSTHVVFTLLSNPRKKMYNLKAEMLTTHSFPVTPVSCLSSLSSCFFLSLPSLLSHPCFLFLPSTLLSLLS